MHLLGEVDLIKRSKTQVLFRIPVELKRICLLNNIPTTFSGQTSISFLQKIVRSLVTLNLIFGDSWRRLIDWILVFVFIFTSFLGWRYNILWMVKRVLVSERRKRTPNGRITSGVKFLATHFQLWMYSFFAWPLIDTIFNKFQNYT